MWFVRVAWMKVTEVCGSLVNELAAEIQWNNVVKFHDRVEDGKDVIKIEGRSCTC